MTIIFPLDAAMLAAFTRAAHAFQRLTERTNFYLAKLSRFAAFASVATSFANYVWKFLPVRTHAWELFLLTLVALGLARDGKLCDDADREFRLGASGVLPRSVLRLRRMTSVAWRISFLAMSGVSLMIFYKVALQEARHVALQFAAGALFPVACTAFLYLIAVDPLPPAKSKVREWIESFSRGKLVPVKAER